MPRADSNLGGARELLHPLVTQSTRHLVMAAFDLDLDGIAWLDGKLLPVTRLLINIVQ